MNLRRIETILIALIGTHSVILGAAMLFFPAATLALFGWQYDELMFFPSQTGIFLTLLGGSYLAAIRHRPFIWLILISKATAVIFLVTEHIILGPESPLTVLAAAIGDGLMGATLATIIILKKRQSKPQQRP